VTRNEVDGLAFVVVQDFLHGRQMLIGSRGFALHRGRVVPDLAHGGQTIPHSLDFAGYTDARFSLLVDCSDFALFTGLTASFGPIRRLANRLRRCADGYFV
jgi:hypothetical protein